MRSLLAFYRAQRASEKGFGLVELIVVVAILGILVIVAIPIYGAIQDKAGREAAQVAANNAYTLVLAEYERDGRAAAKDALNALDRQTTNIAYEGRDFNYRDPADYPAGSTWRTFMERVVAGGAFANVDITTPGVGGDKNHFDVSLNSSAIPGDGTLICVTAYYGDKSGIKHVALAGPGCETPF